MVVKTKMGYEGNGGSRGPRRDSRGPRRDGGRFGGPREMHDAKCADCGQDCQVPFKPSGDKPVYCRDCFAKHKPKRY